MSGGYDEARRLQQEVHRLEDAIRQIEGRLDSLFFWKCIALSAFLISMLSLWH
jgi:hypothetical protein